MLDEPTTTSCKEEGNPVDQGIGADCSDPDANLRLGRKTLRSSIPLASPRFQSTNVLLVNAGALKGRRVIGRDGDASAGKGSNTNYDSNSYKELASTIDPRTQCQTNIKVVDHNVTVTGVVPPVVKVAEITIRPCVFFLASVRTHTLVRLLASVRIGSFDIPLPPSPSPSRSNYYNTEQGTGRCCAEYCVWMPMLSWDWRRADYFSCPATNLSGVLSHKAIKNRKGGGMHISRASIKALSSILYTSIAADV
ncbi:hypothetical protein AG1IA_04487 [Rhizoctonia solani AG-1 IA]|uniref:Uncharacterized protein n=1 Tax=Thanatephorus cucumeris (strain AG1-IA) TaxID=983506 RepID=L8WTL5_THACA|nr:hypothetical protein AG1IA_04487 [Rhizoctonia solani AG-1 IA]